MGEEKRLRTLPATPVTVYYLIFGRENKGLEVPPVLLNIEERVLPVFSSIEAAQGFLVSRTLGEGWHVRLFSAGELISLLFAFHTRIKQVMPNPLPEPLLAEDELSPLMSRDHFIELLIRD